MQQAQDDEDVIFGMDDDATAIIISADGLSEVRFDACLCRPGIDVLHRSALPSHFLQRLQPALLLTCMLCARPHGKHWCLRPGGGDCAIG